MKQRTPFGYVRPFIMYVAAYLIALTFSVIICVTVFNRYNTSSSKKDAIELSAAEKKMPSQKNDTQVAVLIKAK